MRVSSATLITIIDVENANASRIILWKLDLAVCVRWLLEKLLIYRVARIF